ncbi:hypothetical protein DPMN_154971 [Dreissena polymorpha]|uniref:Uncharacterized protein n=1 Tax=Dreissena polymorpha TaxID=45954 RepID=A0A9D4FM28_DREPO|nr:hypothetical protein DPMN_154971 [Dreissena polymorpha]
MLKLAQTDRQTNRQTGQKQYVPHYYKCLQTKCGRTDSGQRPILKPHLSNQCSITRKTAPPPWRPYIYKTNHFTKFHDDLAKNVTSRKTNVLTKFHENWAKNVTSR